MSRPDDDPAIATVARIVTSMTETIAKQTLIGVDPADYRALFKDAGPALHGEGEASGEGRATRAADAAIADLKRRLAESRR